MIKSLAVRKEELQPEGTVNSTVGGTENRAGNKRKSYRNVCQSTGRARGIVKEIRVSRYIYRKKADRGGIEGVRRSSW